MVYFAYGSNMDWAQMKRRCPSSKFICVAELRDHSLAFTRRSVKPGCGVADVVPDHNQNVWGVVYHIDETDIRRLDKAEGYDPGRDSNSYIRKERHVFAERDDKRPLLVSIYFAEQQSDPPPPNSEYKRLIVEGAQFWHLPEEYISRVNQIKSEN